jgi:hypothetical protein
MSDNIFSIGEQGAAALSIVSPIEKENKKRFKKQLI